MARKSRGLFHVGREAILRQMIEDEQLTQAEVARRLGVHTATIERSCKRLGLRTQRTGPRALEGHPNWNGGIYLCKGYRYVRADDHPNRTKNGYVAEHRLVMEAKLGRFLARHEVVHHIDGNPLNNHPDNLMAFQSNPEHLRHELTGRVPAWTPEGVNRIKAGIHRSIANRRASKQGGSPQPQSTDHPPSSPGSNGASPASGTVPTPTP